MVEVVLALGSNLGCREEYLEAALESLRVSIDIELVSSWYENPAIGGPEGQNDFLNGVAKGATEMTAFQLLEFIKNIEFKLGRDMEAERWSERVIDIDIIYYGDEVVESAELTIPHALMHERDFVLIPLNEICPDIAHPLLRLTASQMLEVLE